MSGTPTQKEDIEFGKASEISNVDLLQMFLRTTLQKDEDEYAVFDWQNPTKTIFCELKTRRIPHDRWDTALIGMNKIAFADRMDDVEFWFAYCYSDGVFVIKYEKTVFDNFEVRKGYVRGPRNDASNRPSDVCLIPREHLKKITLEELMERDTVVVEGPTGAAE
jgi:hypothetical protein